MQGPRKRLGIRRAERRSAPGVRNRQEHFEEALDAAVAVAQQPERRVEPVIDRLTNLHEHRVA